MIGIEEKKVIDAVNAELVMQERRLSWLSEKSGVPYGTLYDILVKMKSPLKGEKLHKVNSVLKTQIAEQ